MWIEAESGKLINLAHAAQIVMTKLEATTTFVAYFPGSSETEPGQERTYVELVTAHNDHEVEQVKANLRSIIQSQALTTGRLRRNTA